MRAAMRLSAADEAVLEHGNRGQVWASAYGMSGEVPPPTRSEYTTGRDSTTRRPSEW